jgi:hypothetical protein
LKICFNVNLRVVDVVLRDAVREPRRRQRIGDVVARGQRRDGHRVGGVVDEGDAEVPVSGDGCGSGFERHAVVLLELVRGFAPSR